MTYMEHLRDNLCTFSPLKPLTEAEMRFLDEDISKQIVGYNTIPCNDCKYCMPCPYGIDIPGISFTTTSALVPRMWWGKPPTPITRKRAVPSSWATTAACQSCAKPTTA